MRQALPLLLPDCLFQAARPGAGVTAYEGARIIVGDGSPAIEKGTIVVNGANIQQAGNNVQVPAGATSA